MNSVWAALKQFLCFKCVLKVFFSTLLSCVEFGSSGLLPPSQPSAQSEHCVYVCLCDSQWLSWCETVSSSVCVMLSGGEALCATYDQGKPL